jgi:hypothetical protein
LSFLASSTTATFRPPVARRLFAEILRDNISDCPSLALKDSLQISTLRDENGIGEGVNICGWGFHESGLLIGRKTVALARRTTHRGDLQHRQISCLITHMPRLHRLESSALLEDGSRERLRAPDEPAVRRRGCSSVAQAPGLSATDALHRDRTDLFGLSFGIAVETGVASLK